MTSEEKAFGTTEGHQNIVCRKNPIIAGKGICDPHLQLFENKVYLYTSHDKDPGNMDYEMNDWMVWSTEDFVSWKMEGVIRPEDFYMGSSKACWAVDAACSNGKYYFYYSNGNEQTGVAVGNHPWGIFTDCENSPLLDGTLTPTREYDPAVFKDIDGAFYIVFGGPAWAYGEGSGYFIARLNEDMCSLAESPRRIELDHEGDDKASLNRIGDTYYLSYGSNYAVSNHVYGPYHYKGNTGASEDHGSYLEWNNQLFNSFTIFDPTMYHRASGICYVHQKKNLELVVDPLIVEYGVGQYDSDWNKIEAEWYMKMYGAAIKTDNPRHGFDVEIFENQERDDTGILHYPNIRNVKDKKGMAFFASCDCPGGAVVEVWQQDTQERLLGTCHIAYTGDHSWRSFRMFTCLLPDTDTDLLNIKLIIKVQGLGSCRLDYFKFFKKY